MANQPNGDASSDASSTTSSRSMLQTNYTDEVQSSSVPYTSTSNKPDQSNQSVPTTKITARQRISGQSEEAAFKKLTNQKPASDNFQFFLLFSRRCTIDKIDSTRNGHHHQPTTNKNHVACLASKPGSHKTNPTPRSLSYSAVCL